METQKGYVKVAGMMSVGFTVELPIEHCSESVACDDPAKEAAMQAVSQLLEVWLWGEDKPPAKVFTEVCEQDVEVEDDDREPADDVAGFDFSDLEELDLELDAPGEESHD